MPFTQGHAHSILCTSAYAKVTWNINDFISPLYGYQTTAHERMLLQIIVVNYINYKGVWYGIIHTCMQERN